MFVTRLFDTSDFPPRWQCGHWSAWHGGAHVVSDLAVAAAAALAGLLVYGLSRRGRLPFPLPLRLFVAFFLAFGLAHLIDASVFWHPWYRFLGLAKAVTAVLAWAALAALVCAGPWSLALTGPEAARHVAELQRSNGELDRFALTAAHDLKAPLRGLAQLAGWVREDAAALLPEEPRRNLDLMQHRVVRLQRLIDDLLDYSRIGHAGHAAEAVDVAALVHEVVDLLALPPGFVVRVGPAPALTCHQAPLRQVLLNLIGNAHKHHHRVEGVIAIEASRNRAIVEFVVRDDGPGIAPEHQAMVFEPFRTLKSRDRVEGSGLGLSLVKKIVESVGGTITLRSSEGAGAAFHFTWPASQGCIPPE